MGVAVTNLAVDGRYVNILHQPPNFFDLPFLLLVLQIGNEGMIHIVDINDNPIPPFPSIAWNAPY